MKIKDFKKYDSEGFIEENLFKKWIRKAKSILSILERMSIDSAKELTKLFSF